MKLQVTIETEDTIDTYVNPPENVEVNQLGMLVRTDEGTESYKAEEIESVSMTWVARNPGTSRLLEEFNE